MFVEEIKQIEREYRELGRKTRQEIAELKRYLNDLNHELGKKFKELEELRAWEKVGDDKSKEIEATTKKIQYLQDKFVETDDMIKDKEQNILDNLEVNMNRARTQKAKEMYPEIREYYIHLKKEEEELKKEYYKVKKEIRELNTEIRGLNAYLEGRKMGINQYEAVKGQAIEDIINGLVKYKNMKQYQEIGNKKREIRELETDKMLIEGLKNTIMEELKQIEHEHKIYKNRSRALSKKQEELKKIKSKLTDIDNKIQIKEKELQAYRKAVNEAIFLKLFDEIIPRLEKAMDKKKLRLRKIDKDLELLRKAIKEAWREKEFIRRVAGWEWVHDYDLKQLAK